MFEIRAVGDGWYLVDDGARRWRVAVAGDQSATWVFVDGQVTKLEPAANEGRPRGRGRGDASVMSPMPATVVAINAAPGQTVSEGDTLIVLEAMKMELPIRAPRQARVKVINCAKGDLVQPGVRLLELE